MVTAAEAEQLPAPDQVLAVLADPPVWEKRVLELALEWPGLSDAQALVALRLQVFLLTWDPFEWRAERANAFATTSRRADGFGLVLYLPLWQALSKGASDPEGLAGALGRLGESVLSVAIEHEAAVAAGDYPEAVLAGTVPHLLSRVGTESALGAPAIRLVDDGWRPVGFDVLEDLGQEIFGPADLDRSSVVLAPATEKAEGCLGCAGTPLTFPDDLKEAQTTLCSFHRAETLQVTTARLERAKASNPAGWEALLEAGQHLAEPHLPNGLGPRLAAAAAGATAGTATTAEVEAQVALVLEAASLMTGLPDPRTPLGARLEPVRAWLRDLPEVLAGRGLGDQSAQVTAAAAELLAPPSTEPAHQGATDPADQGRGAAAGAPKPEPVRVVRIRRNDPCPCGSGKKYKYCCSRL